MSPDSGSLFLTDDLVHRLRGVKVADLADGGLHIGFQVSAARPELRAAVPYSSLVGLAVTVRCTVEPGLRDYTDQAIDLYERGLPRRHAVVVQQNDVPGFTSIGSGGARVARAHGYDGWITSGPLRDTDDLREIRWPVYGTSVVPAGRLVTDTPAAQSFKFTFDVTADIAGMTVAPGDIVVGDNDGVIAIPQEHLLAILGEAEGIVHLERRYFRLLDEGKSFRQIIEAERAASARE